MKNKLFYGTVVAFMILLLPSLTNALIVQQSPSKIQTPTFEVPAVQKPPVETTEVLVEVTPETPPTPTQPEETPTPEHIEIQSSLLTCGDAPTINIDLATLPKDERHKTIQSYLNHYRDYLYNGIYKLCFIIQNETSGLTAGVTFGTQSIEGFTDKQIKQESDDKPVLISGLKLRRESSAEPNFDLFTINSPLHVTLISSNIQGAGAQDLAKCLVVKDGVNTIKNSSFAGCKIGILDQAANTVIESSVDVSNSATGVELSGTGAKITSSTIHNNGFGVLIGGSNNTLGPLDVNNFSAEANSIYGNNVGILYESVLGNRSPFNLIYNNNKIAGTNTSDDAISINPTLNISRPEITFIDPADKPDDPEMALHCVKDKNEIITGRWLKFNNANNQEIIIYETSTLPTEPPQAKNYLMKCTVDADGKCPITFPTSITISEGQCGPPDLYAVALVNAAYHTSMLTPSRFKLDGVVTLGTGSEGGIINPVPGDKDPGDSDKLDLKNPLGSDYVNELGGGDDTSSGGGARLKAGPGGSGCGGFIVPPNDHYTIGSGLVMWWIIFATPVVLIAVRIKRKK